MTSYMLLCASFCATTYVCQTIRTCCVPSDTLLAKHWNIGCFVLQSLYAVVLVMPLIYIWIMPRNEILCL